MTLSDLLPKTASEVTAILVGVGNAVATAYLWWVRANRERPRLETRLIAVDTVDAARAFERTWDPVVTLRVAVTNLSALPNVVLGVRGWVRQKDGAWAAADVRFKDGVGAFNVAPQVAEFRALVFDLPAVPTPNLTADELDRLDWRRTLEPALGGEMAFRVELVSLGNKTFTDEIRVPPAG